MRRSRDSLVCRGCVLCQIHTHGKRGGSVRCLIVGARRERGRTPDDCARPGGAAHPAGLNRAVPGRGKGLRRAAPFCLCGWRQVNCEGLLVADWQNSQRWLFTTRSGSPHEPLGSASSPRATRLPRVREPADRPFVHWTPIAVSPCRAVVTQRSLRMGGSNCIHRGLTPIRRSG